MKEVIFIVEEAAEGGYIAKGLGHDIFTEAEDVAQLKEQVKEAVLCHFDEAELPQMIRLHFVREEILPVAV
ncbi:2-oxoisovalerate dehydrogenase E1 subunit beta [soil metagenome]